MHASYIVPRRCFVPCTVLRLAGRASYSPLPERQAPCTHRHEPTTAAPVIQCVRLTDCGVAVAAVVVAPCRYSKQALRAIAAAAQKKGTGTRGLRCIMENLLVNSMFEVGEGLGLGVWGLGLGLRVQQAAFHRGSAGRPDGHLHV